MSKIQKTEWEKMSNEWNDYANDVGKSKDRARISHRLDEREKLKSGGDAWHQNVKAKNLARCNIAIESISFR